MGRMLKRIGLHILFWILIVLYFAWGFGLDLNPMQSFRNALYFIPGHLLIVYGVLYFLVPKYLLHRKYWQFFLGLFILTSICAFYTILAQLSISSNPKLQGANITVGRNVLPFIHVAAIAASIKLFKFWYVQRKYTVDAEQQRTVAELKLLKATSSSFFI